MTNGSKIAVICCNVFLDIYFWIVVRSYILEIERYRLNKSAYKKIRKDQTLFEWFTHKRFLDVIPKIFLIWYYETVALNFLIEIVAIVLYLYDYTYYANLIIVLKIIKDGICKSIANIMLRKPKNNKKGETEYSKWFEKRPGKKK